MLRWTAVASVGPPQPPYGAFGAETAPAGTGRAADRRRDVVLSAVLVAMLVSLWLSFR